MGGMGSGRRPGDKDKTPRKTRVVSGAVPPTSPTEDIRAQVLAAKGSMTEVLLGPGMKWIRKIIEAGPPEYSGMQDGGRVLLAGSAQFEWAMNFAADRGFMPRRSEAELTQPGGFKIVIDDARGALGWPVAVGGGDARDDGERPAVAN